MKVHESSEDDCVQMARILEYLKVGTWTHQGDEVDRMQAAKRWLAEIATQMALDLKAQKDAAKEAKGMTIEEAAAKSPLPVGSLPEGLSNIKYDPGDISPPPPPKPAAAKPKAKGSKRGSRKRRK